MERRRRSMRDIWRRKPISTHRVATYAAAFLGRPDCLWRASSPRRAPHPRRWPKGSSTTSFNRASSHLHELYGRPPRPPSTPAPNFSVSGGSGPRRPRYHRLVRHRVPRVRLLRGNTRPRNSSGPFRARRKVDARRVDVLDPFAFGARARFRGCGAPNSLTCRVVSFGG